MPLPFTVSFSTLCQPCSKARRINLAEYSLICSKEYASSHLASYLGSDDQLPPPGTILVSSRRTWVQRKPDKTHSANEETDRIISQTMREASWDTQSTASIQETTQKRETVTNSTSRVRRLRLPRQQTSDQNRRPMSYLRGNFRNDDSDISFMKEARTLRTQQKQTRRQSRRSKMNPMPVRGYDAAAIEDYYDLRPLEVGWRLNSLGFPLLGWYHSLLMDKALKRDKDIAIQRQRGRELRDLLINSNSVALIKSGQALSLRPDLVLNPYWAEELGKLVDAVGAFPDEEAMEILRSELSDLRIRIESAREKWEGQTPSKINRKMSKLQKMVLSDPVLSLFEFYNDNQVVASASIGQVYKARIRSGPQLEAAIGVNEALKWGGKDVAIKVQRPDVVGSASLDMYLLRRTTTWLSRVRGGNLPKIADAFGMQLFGELDYIREANNCERFRELYGTGWDDVVIPAACTRLTRQRVLVLEWIEGEKGPWDGDSALEMVSIGLRCSVDQLMNTGLFHADPHRGNLLKTPDNKLGLIDFGSVVDINEDFRYSLFGLVIGLQNKDLPLVTENLLKLGFLKDTKQLDQIVPRLTKALKVASGGTGKASDVNFARLQAELDEISRENILKFSTPPFFTIILRSLTILEGVAQSVDKNFRLVRGAYPYVLRQLLASDGIEGQPKALQKLLVRLLTVNGKGEEIKWETLRDFLRLAQKATKRYNPVDKEVDQVDEDKAAISRKTLELFTRFLTSGAGNFLKKPLIHELAETIDGMASIGEGMLIKASRGLLPVLPGMNGPVNSRRMDEVSALIETFQNALITQEYSNKNANNPNRGFARMQAMIELVRELAQYASDSSLREEAGPLLEEVRSVIQLVALEVLEIRGSRTLRTVLRLQTT